MSTERPFIFVEGLMNKGQGGAQSGQQRNQGSKSKRAC